MPFIYSLLVHISGSFCLSVYLCIYLSIHLSVSLCSSGWPKTLYIDQVGFKLPELHSFAFQWLNAYANTSSLLQKFFKNIFKSKDNNPR